MALKTPTVDGSALVSATPEIAKSRAKYWGFDFKKLPINGRVWYPEGDGPFPLVLVVHGNHNMKDFSDPGYGYLGQLLASRGFILASVDENFINGNLRGENDGRGWLLLEHLQARGARGTTRQAARSTARWTWATSRSWDTRAAARRSRVAAAFNRLSHYPDDATVQVRLQLRHQVASSRSRRSMVSTSRPGSRHRSRT